MKNLISFSKRIRNKFNQIAILLEKKCEHFLVPIWMFCISTYLLSHKEISIQVNILNLTRYRFDTQEQHVMIRI